MAPEQPRIQTSMFALPQPAPPCKASEIKLTFEGRDGQFAGMSHDGAVLVLRNIGHRTCAVPRRPQLTFTDADNKPVPLTAHIPPGMHPGPVPVPLSLAPGKAASGKMRWVIGQVYDQSTCVAPVHAALQLGNGTLTQNFSTTVCTQTGTPANYEQEWLQPCIHGLSLTTPAER